MQHFEIMKILVTGGSGLLGSAISLYFKDYFDVVSSYSSHKVEIKGCNTMPMDITDPRDTLDVVKKINPGIIVHTAALVGASICEKKPELAYNVNVHGTKNIVEASKKTGSKIVYISTDYVFDGKKGDYDECDNPNPINVYGKTKYEGELFIDTKKHAIIRTSIYGWNIIKDKRSFSTWIIDELRNKKQVNVFIDNINSMMLVNNLAEALNEFIEKDLSGIMNIASSEAICKYDFAVKLADVFKLDKGLIKALKNEEAEGSDKRPLNVSLSVSKARKELKTKLFDAKKGLLQLKKLEANSYLSNYGVM